MQMALWYFILNFCFLQTLAGEILKPFSGVLSSECAKEVNLDQSKLSAIINKNFYIHIEDPDLYVFVECMFNKHNIIKSNNEIDKEAYIDAFAQRVSPLLKNNYETDLAVVSNVFDNCKNWKGDNKGERLVNFHNCIVDKLKLKNN